MNRPSEFHLIAELFAPLATAPGALGLKDDAALITPPEGCDLVVTADALVEGVHFLSSDPPDTIARKALRVNLSDLAAKGAVPTGYFLAVSLPNHLEYGWLTEFARGLAEDGKAFSIPLMGGDTTSTPGPLTIAITAFGYVPRGTMTQRAGAKPGDSVYVSGTIGDAGGGLELLTSETQAGNANAYLIGRYRVPTPRLALGLALRGVATASLDVSDGLIADVGHLADVSQVKIVLDAAQIPLSESLKSLWGTSEGTIVRAATAGDDYEIVFTAGDIDAECLGVRRIGHVTNGSGVFLMGNDGEITVSRTGFQHF